MRFEARSRAACAPSQILLSCWVEIRSFQGRSRGMGNMRVFCMALVAALAPVLAAAPGLQESDTSNAKKKVVNCTRTDKPYEVTVSEPGSTVVVECQQHYTFDPEVNLKPKEQQVYTAVECNPQSLTTVCPGVSIAALNDGKQTPGAKLTVEALPSRNAETFFVQCKPPPSVAERAEGGPACKVQVTVNKAAVEGPQNQTGTGGQPGKVHVCTPPGASITVSVPAKDSSVQFQCAKPFKLYPTNAKRVFKDDCKTEEDLKDMTRTDAPAATTTTGAGNQAQGEAAQPVYTLRADKKPPKKKLCYLCATQEASDKAALPPDKYCAIYVESSARAQFDAVLTPALMLWCALVVIHAT